MIGQPRVARPVGMRLVARAARSRPHNRVAAPRYSVYTEPLRDAHGAADPGGPT